MENIKLPSNEIIFKKEIDHLIAPNIRKNPFKSQEESEEFYKNLIKEEMILSNDYNSTNIEKLLNLYLKGINLYQNIPDSKEINSFTDKINLLLNATKTKSTLNEEKKKEELYILNEDSDFDEDKNNNNNNNSKIWNNSDKRLRKINVNLLRSKTSKNNVIINKNKLKNLTKSIMKGMKEKEYQKKKIDEINNEYNNIKKQYFQTSLFLKDEIQKQSNDFKEKLLKKKTIVQKGKLKKNKMNVSEDDNLKEDGKIKIYRNKTPEKNNNQDLELNFNKLNNKEKTRKNSITNQKFINSESNLNIIKEESGQQNDAKNILNEKIYKYFDEYNEEVYQSYFLKTIKKISELIEKNISLNMKINDEYQNNIKDLLKMQLDDNNNNIIDEDIDNLKEEQKLEIQKNDELYEKYIEEEISNFKLYGYSSSCPKELELLKNKIKCEIYNDMYNNLLNTK